MSNVEIGQLLNGTEQRDAIHIAIAPVVAVRTLNPGTPITFVDDDMMKVDICPKPVSIGIVDPYLERAARPGDRFYMFVNPNTITSLRHEWTHPAFKDGLRELRDITASEEWLRDYCNNHVAPPFRVLMAALKSEDGQAYDVASDVSVIIENGYISVCGRDACAAIPDEFWTHAEIVTGKKFTDKPGHFSCSC